MEDERFGRQVSLTRIEPRPVHFVLHMRALVLCSGHPQVVLRFSLRFRAVLVYARATGCPVLRWYGLTRALRKVRS
eukprot:2051711-Rhodomonas_salina.1